MRLMVVVCAVAACGDNIAPDFLVFAAGATPGANVVFFDDDATLIAEVPADADGNAQAQMPLGGSVLTNQTGHCGGQVYTAVKPGDHVVFAPSLVTDSAITTMTATFTPVPGADTATFYTSCGSTRVGAKDASAILTFDASCRQPTFDVVMVATGTALSAPVFTHVSGISHIDGGTFEIEARPITMQNLTLTLHHVPPVPASPLVVTWNTVVGSTIVPIDTMVITRGASTTTIELPFPQSLGTASVVSLTWRPYGGDPYINEGLDAEFAATSDAIDLDLSELQPPLPTHDVGSAGYWDATTGVRPDTAKLLWSGLLNGVPSVYEIVGPWNNQLAMPRLPDKYAACDVTPAPDGFVEYFSVQAVNYSQIENYEQFLQQPSDLFADLGSIAPFTGEEIHRSLISQSAIPLE